MLDRLFQFQLEDVNYLARRTNVADFSDMGTGKTYKAVALDGIRRTVSDGPTLVVAPLSVLPVWEQHYRELTNLRVTVIDPKRRHEFLRTPSDVYCIHWEALRLMPELARCAWLHVIGDEAQKAKNRKASQTKAFKKIPAGYRTALTGTPIINRPDDLWSILNWLYPQERDFRSYWRFFNTYVEAHKPLEHCPREDCTVAETVNPHGKNVDKWYVIHGPKNEKRLQRLIKPFTVRRMKKDVLPQLPEKYYSAVYVDLSPTQRRVYNEMRDDMIAWLEDGQALTAPVVIAQLIRLQQISLATPIIGEGHWQVTDEAGVDWYDTGFRIKTIVGLEEPSTKLDALMDIIEGTDRKIVVWTQFKKMADLASERFERSGIKHVRLTGDETGSDREGSISQFQSSPAVQVLVGTIKTGGVGITLTAADAVVFLDRDWSPANNAQAEDRLHRIGQQNAVHVIDIVARDTVDQPRGRKLELKQSWIRSVLGDAV